MKKSHAPRKSSLSMPADWSSIGSGYAVVWVPLALFGAALYWRLRRARSAEDD
jgi:hypothetical protein